MIFNNEIWKKLESESPKGEKITARLVVPEISRKLYAGFDSNKKRHLLISLYDSDEEYHDLQSKGFSIVTRELIVKGREASRYIDITCNDNSGHLIFDVIASEIAEKLDSGESKEVLTNVISKWRRFWGQSPKEILTYEELIGLFAEMWFLYYWLFPRTDKVDALNRWRGPFSSRHDFEWQANSVEVKATTNVQSRVHKIHGVDQLTPSKNGALFLFSLRLREEQGAENNLPDFIKLCQEKLKDNVDALSKFENNLAVAGYSPVHNDEYSKFKFRVVDEKLYKVTKGFPRIINDSFVQGIPHGVGTIEYIINLDGYDSFCIANSPTDKIEL